MSESAINNLDDIPLVFDCQILATILGVSRSTARSIMHSEGFPVVVAGPRRHRIYRPAFLEWLEKQAKTGLQK